MATIRKLSLSEQPEWDRYVLSQKDSTFYHLSGWREVISKSYGHESFYILAEAESRFVGVLPSYIMKSKIFGSKIISLPFCSYGGPLSENRIVADKLINELNNCKRFNGYNYIEIRTKRNNSYNYPYVFDDYISLILELDNDPEMIWKNKLNKKVRNATRKAIKRGVKHHSGKKYLIDFFKLYSESMKIFGTPSHSYVFFKNVIKYFPENVTVEVSKLGNRVIAAMIVFWFKDTATSVWAASDFRYLDWNPNNILYWEVIKKSSVKSYDYFDFGRSVKNSGTFSFKKSWGAEVVELYYYSDEKYRDTSQKNYKRDLFAKIWNKLPLYCTTLLGPFFRKHVP